MENLCTVRAQLANPALSEEEKAALRELQQQQLAAKQDEDRELGALRTALEQLNKGEEQLRAKELMLMVELKELRNEPAPLNAPSMAADPERFKLQRQLDALPNPSDMAYSKQWSQNHAFFRCFRPAAGVGPTRALPIGLYDPVLDKLVELFGAALGGGGGGGIGSSGGGGGADGVPPSDADCDVAIRLCMDMAESFADEAARMAAFNEMLQDYLYELIGPHYPIRTAEFGTDGSLLCKVSGPASSTWLPVYIQNVKLEIGTQGDPYFQGQRQYQILLANPELAALVRDTVLPVLFVELVGPHLRVSALASPADVTVVCEPLTPYLHLFNMQRFQPDHMIRVALVLRALKHGIALLKDACGLLQQTTITASPSAARSASAAPASASAGGLAPGASSPPAASASSGGEAVAAARPPRAVVPLRDPCLQLPYPLRPGQGFRDVRPIGAGVYHPLYFAVLEDSNRAVAIKFTRPSADAVRVHRAWAAAGLAPEVLQERRLPCGLTMLVMEQLEAEDGWAMFYNLLQHRKRQLHGAVVAALDRAHAVVVDAERGLPGVHADLRQANVMVRLLPPPPPPPRGDDDTAEGRSGSGGGPRGGGGGGAAVAAGRDESDEGAGGGSSSSCREPQLPQQVEVRFVDFDWSGLQGHTRLPAFSRMRLPGYGSGCEVTQEYDRALWEHERVHGPD